MKISRFSISAILLSLLSFLPAGAAIKDLPVKNVNGRMYHYYEVPAKETVYSLCYKLDISKDEMIRHNPPVADGLRAGMILYFPAEDTTAGNQTQGSKIILHHVQKGETIFGIANKYGVKTNDIIEQNPILKNGLKAGQTIEVKVKGSTDDESKAQTTATPADLSQLPPATRTRMEGYIVKKKETFYSIAVSHGITVAALEAANPGVTMLKEGQVLNIPVTEPEGETKSDLSATPSSTLPTDQPTAPLVTSALPVSADSITPALSEMKPESVSMAVLLPFMLKEEELSKNATRYTEFYKGLLLAVDSLRRRGPIHVTAYDTEGSVLKVREILSDTAFHRHNLIIAPDNTAQMAILAEYGKNNDVKVINSFIVRDDSYMTNPAMIQANLPSRLMYRKAIDALINRLTYSTPVFINIKGSAADKADFTSELRKTLDAKGKSYMELEVDGSLTLADLKPLPADGNYTFIPTSSKQADLNKLMPGIIEWRDQAATPMVRLFGYPEWTTFRGETLENMHNLNTTVYSRFFTDEDSPRTKAVDGMYRKWYGTRMENAVPRQGLLGFDTGMFAIPYILDGANGYDGVQNGFFITNAGDNAGYYNDALYLINFRPGDITDKTRI